MASYGFLIYGPLSQLWYEVLDHLMPMKNLTNLSLKVFMMFPRIASPSFYSLMNFHVQPSVNNPYLDFNRLEKMRSRISMIVYRCLAT